MNFNIKKCAAAMLATAAALCATAQNTQSGYFLDDYAYRFLSNPALAPSFGKSPCRYSRHKQPQHEYARQSRPHRHNL